MAWWESLADLAFKINLCGLISPAQFRSMGEGRKSFLTVLIGACDLEARTGAVEQSCGGASENKLWGGRSGHSTGTRFCLQLLYAAVGRLTSFIKIWSNRLL